MATDILREQEGAITQSFYQPFLTNSLHVISEDYLLTVLIASTNTLSIVYTE